MNAVGSGRLTTHTPVDADQAAEQAGMVSAVIIFLNEARFLRDAIESVLAQAYPLWELLLVDDGSTDGSADIAQEFEREHSGIRYLAHPDRANRGMSASRNLGLSHARGEFVAFLDADDVYLPQHFRRHVEVLSTRSDIAMSVSSHIRWFDDGSDSKEPPEIGYVRPLFVAGDLIWKPPLGLMVVMSVPYLNVGTCNLMVRRRIALEIGGFEDSFRSMYEDQVFAAKVLARYPVYVMQAYLARYRHHHASATRKAKATREFIVKTAYADTTRFFNWLFDYLRQHGIDDPVLLDLVRQRQQRDGRQPGLLARLQMHVSASLKQFLAHVLPSAWRTRLLVLDYETDCRRAQRAYQRLTRILTRRALAEAVKRDGS
jgi:glycosyltransferase involved in cell wall biosynthesis